MIGKATIFAVALLAPGIAFAADSVSTSTAPAVTTHDSAGTGAAAKADVKSDAKADVKVDAKAKPDAAVVKTAKAKAHKAKAVPAVDKKTDTKTETKS